MGCITTVWQYRYHLQPRENANLIISQTIIYGEGAPSQSVCLTHHMLSHGMYNTRLAM